MIKLFNLLLETIIESLPANYRNLEYPNPRYTGPGSGFKEKIKLGYGLRFPNNHPVKTAALQFLQQLTQGGEIPSSGHQSLHPQLELPFSQTSHPSTDSGEDNSTTSKKVSMPPQVRELPVEQQKAIEENPHIFHPGWTWESRAGGFDALSETARVWVFHGTDEATADTFLTTGVHVDKKPHQPTRDQFKAGTAVTFGPGLGLSEKIYVGSDPMNVSGYGKRILAFHVPKSAVQVSPEQAMLGQKTRGDAISHSDAIIMGNIEPPEVVDVTQFGKYVAAYTIIPHLQADKDKITD